MTNWPLLQNSIANNRAAVTAELLKYLPTDVLLFWSDKKDIGEKQKQCWQPLLDILAECGLKLQISRTLEVADNESNKPIFQQLLRQLNDEQLTVCYAAATRLHSVLLGYLLAAKSIDAQTAFQAAYWEELYQNTQWGEDEQALQQRQTIQQELQELQRIA